MPHTKVLVDIITIKILNISFHWFFGLYSFCGKIEMLSYGWSFVYDKLLFSWCLEHSLLCFGFWQFYYNMPYCESVWFYSSWSLTFWISRFRYFAKFWKFSVILILNTYSFLISLLGLYKVDVTTIDWVPWVP